MSEEPVTIELVKAKSKSFERLHAISVSALIALTNALCFQQGMVYERNHYIFEQIAKDKADKAAREADREAQEIKDKADSAAREIKDKQDKLNFKNEMEGFSASLALKSFDCFKPLMGQVKTYNAGTDEQHIYKTIRITGAKLVDPALTKTNGDSFPIRLTGKTSDNKEVSGEGYWNKSICPAFVPN